MIHTSYFANHRSFEDKKTVSIARFTPHWIKVDSIALELAPSVDLLMQLKHNVINIEEYAEKYKNEVLFKLNPAIIFEKYRNTVFLCFEKKGEFCHRQLVAEWLKENGFNIQEL